MNTRIFTPTMQTVLAVAILCLQGCGAPSQQNNPPPTNPYCGDGACNGNESQLNCAVDCGNPPPGTDTTTPTPYCGDGACNGNESQLTCAQDCGDPPPATDTTTPTPYCGDGVCNGNESQLTCAQDCGDPPPSSTCANAPDGTLCDDGNPMTSYDACLNGTCQGQLSQAGWHYQFDPGISGRFSRIRIQQFGGLSWSPWMAVADEWQLSYMGSTFPGSYPDYSVEIENDCLDPADAEAFTNAALSDWFTTSGNALSKPGFMVLRRADGSKEVVLSTIEASIQSYSPPFGSCQTQEAIAMKGLKMKVVDCVNDTHCVEGKTCNSLSMCSSN